MVQVKKKVWVTRKDGVRQRYTKWVEEEEEYRIRIVEWIFNFIPTRDERPSSPRDWEVRIQAPDDTPEQMIRYYAEESLEEEMSDEGGASMVESSSVISKEGVDFIEYSDIPYIRYKIVDKTRPQYRYPKQGWGSIK
jgi:hypothetical protein